MYILLKANGRPTLYYPTHFFPLRIIKQVLTMFFSISKQNLSENEPELVKFILNKEQRFLNPKYRIYAYYNLGQIKRYIGDTYTANISSMKAIHVSEITFHPFGFVFSINSPRPDARLLDISNFATFEYNQQVEVYEKHRILPTFFPHFPLDYRTKEEIIVGVQEARKIKSGRNL